MSVYAMPENVYCKTKKQRGSQGGGGSKQEDVISNYK